MATKGIREIAITNDSNYLIEPTLYTTVNQTSAATTFTADLDKFELFNGVTVAVNFGVTNNANATLNINSTGDKPIQYNGAAIAANILKENHIYNFVYDGTNWQLIGNAIGTEASDAAAGDHVHGNITNDGKIGTATNRAVYTTTGGLLTAGSLSVTDNTTIGDTATTFVAKVTQNGIGKITVTKAALPTASTDTAGIIQIGTGATNAAAGNHTHSITNLTDINSLWRFTGGTTVTNGTDFNTLVDIGNYYQTANNNTDNNYNTPMKNASVTNTQLTNKAFTLKIMSSGTSNSRRQIYQHYNSPIVFQRWTTNATQETISWSSWKYSPIAEDYGTAIGGLTQPIYINSEGTILAGTALGNMAYESKDDYATKTEVNGLLAANDALVYKGVKAGANTSSGNTYGALTPAANCGDTYKVSTAGFINGLHVEVGDMLICCATDGTEAATASNYTTIRNNWNIIQTSEGSVSSSITSSTTNTMAIFDGTSGRIIKTASHITAYDANSNITVQNATKYRNGLRIWGQCYGNTPADLTSNTAGVMRYEDGGVRLEFSASETGGSDNAALLFTNHDSANTGGGSSFHFVGQNGSNDTGGNLAVTAPDLVARRRMAIGYNFTDTNYLLKVNGATYINGTTTFTDIVTFANNKLNLMGDDCYIGDQNVAGAICIKGKNGDTSLRFIQRDGTAAGTIKWDGTKFSITSTTAVDASISGNAATATAITVNSAITTATNLDSFLEASKLKATIISNGVTYADGTLTANDGMVVSIGYSNTTYGNQIYVDPDSNKISFRRKSSTWKPWVDILHSDNYNNYVLPLSGGTLTGRLSVCNNENPANTPNAAAIEIREVTRGGTNIEHTLVNAPRLGFHWGSKYWAQLALYDNAFRFYDATLTNYYPVYASTFYGDLSGNATTSTWTTLIKPINDTTTASASTWSIPSGSYQVWGERFSDTRLKYTPSGGSESTVTDTGDWTMWLTSGGTTNIATLNMRIDGTYYGNFNGTLTGNASGIPQTVTSTASWRKVLLTGGDAYNAWNTAVTSRTAQAYQAVGVSVQPSTGAMHISGPFTTSSTTASTSTTTGALVVGGGAGIAGNLYIGGSTSLGGQTIINYTTPASSAKGSSQLQICDSSTSSPVAGIEIRRGALNNTTNGKASWQIIDEAGELIFRTDYKASGQATTYDNEVMRLKYSTQGATISGILAATGGSFSGEVTLAKANNANNFGLYVQHTNPNNDTSKAKKVALMVGGASGSGGLYDSTKSKWIVYSDTDGDVTLNGNAATATQIAITTSAPTSSKTVGYIPFSTTITGNNDLYAQDSLYLYDTVTSNAISTVYLNVGKNKVMGGITLHSKTNTYYGDLVPETLTSSNKTWTLPNATGTIALTTSDITGNAATASAVQGAQINSETEMTTMGLTLYFGSGGNWTGSIDSMAYAGILQVGNSYTRGWQIWARRGANASLHWRNPKDDLSGWETQRTILDSSNTYAANSNGTAVTVTCGSDATLATINGTTVKINITKPSYNWSDIGSKPIDFITHSGALNSNGWKTLGGCTSGAKIAIAYNNSNASWNSGKYSASIVFGCSDTKGLLDCSYNNSIVTFGGGSVGSSTNDNPVWYFKLSGTSAQTYTFPSTSKTLCASDGSNASGTSWGISITGNATNVTDTVAIANGGTGKTTAAEAWTALGGGESGKHADSYFVAAKSSTTDNAIVRFDDTSGQVQNSTATINDTGTMVIKGKLVVNPSYDTSNSYNEGVRINIGSNGWANAHFGGAADSASGTTDGGWLIGRRGAAGSKCGAIGDFTIEEGNSDGGGLTIHKDYKGMELYTSRVASESCFKITNAGTVAASGWVYGIEVLSANMAANSNITMAVGHSSATKNRGYLGFHYAGSGSNDNYVELGLYGVNGAFKLYGNRLVELTDNLKFTSTTAIKHIEFSRTIANGGPSYICYPETGQLAIGYNVGYDYSIAVFDGNTSLRPGKSNIFYLGTSDYKWKTVYATTFSGSLSGNATSASKISAKLAATTKTYLLGTATAITATAANVEITGDTGVYLTTTAGELSAARHSWNVSGTEKAYTTYNSTDDSIDFIFV